MKKLNKIILILLCVAIIGTLGIITFSQGEVPEISDSYDFKSKNDVLEYIDTAKALNDNLSKKSLEEVVATVTFSKALSKDELKTFIDSYDIDVVQLQVRGYDSEKNRITATSKIDKGLDETFLLLDTTVEGTDTVLVGAIGLNILTDSQSVTEIQKDRCVLLVDTSGDRYHTDGQTEKNRNNSKSSEDTGYFFPKSLSWEAEDYGIVDYIGK